MLKPLRAIKRLRDPRDLWLFLRVLSMLILLPRLIHKLSLPELLARLDPGVLNDAKDEKQLRKTVGFTDSLLRYHVFQRYGKCLLRSLLLFRFLRQQGWPVEIHFGVRKTENPVSDQALQADTGIRGHSWLVLDNKPFLEDNKVDYVNTFRYPHRL